jgi:serine/threonine protein kinase
VILSPVRESDTEFASRIKSIYKEAFKRDPLLAPHAPVALEIIGKLGQGGMGAVFRVKDHRLGRDAALKILSKPNPQNTLRFLNETNITSRLNHPCIPPVYEAGKTPDGQHFILMKIIEGQTLSEEITHYHQHGRPAEKLEELLTVLVKISEAIAYAHEHGIIHRDLKPANIMVGRYGEVMVMDWGIAKNLEISKNPGESLGFGYTTNDGARSSARLEVGSGKVLGTPGYLSPEQARGELLDPRSDVFNLGILLTLILTGEIPTPGDSENGRLAAAIAGIVRRPEELEAKIPTELSSLANKALEVKLQHRMTSAKAFVNDLKAYILGKELKSHQYSKSERILRSIKKQPGGLLGITLMAILLAISGLYIAELQRSANSEERALRQRLEAKSKLQTEALARKQAQQKAERAQKVLELFNKARNLTSRGSKPENIRQTIKAAIKASEHSQTSLMTAAKIYDDAKMTDDLTTTLQENIRKYPPAYQALFYLHKIETRNNQCPEASPFVSKHLQTLADQARMNNTKNEYTILYQAIKAHQSGFLDKAIKLYGTIEEYSKGMLSLYAHRGLAHSQNNQPKQALRDFTRAIEIAPKDASFYGHRALSLLKLKQNQRALTDINHGLSLSPQSQKLLQNRKKILKLIGETQ